MSSLRAAAAAMLAACAPLAPGPSAPARPEIVPRESWGSRPHPIPESRRQTPSWITLHHAGVPWRRGRSPEQFLRDMQRWGQERPNETPPGPYWPDLPYHFLIAPDGRIFEGRPVHFEPDSNTDYPLNGNVGVELMGDFDKQRPTLEQLRSAARLTAWLMREHGIDHAHVRGHRDAAPGQTGCPGADLVRHQESGALKSWIEDALAGRAPRVDPGPPLPGGPTQGVPKEADGTD